MKRAERPTVAKLQREVEALTQRCDGLEAKLQKHQLAIEALKTVADGFVEVARVLLGAEEPPAPAAKRRAGGKTSKKPKD